MPATTVEAGSVGRESAEDSEEDAHPAISIAVAVIAIRRQYEQLRLILFSSESCTGPHSSDPSTVSTQNTNVAVRK